MEEGKKKGKKSEEEEEEVSEANAICLVCILTSFVTYSQKKKHVSFQLLPEFDTKRWSSSAVFGSNTLLVNTTLTQPHTPGRPYESLTQTYSINFHLICCICDKCGCGKLCFKGWVLC